MGDAATSQPSTMTTSAENGRGRPETLGDGDPLPDGPFPVLAGIRRVTSAVGHATFEMNMPAWLRGHGGEATAGAVVALAEIALTGTARTTVGPVEDVVTASLHLDFHGPYPAAPTGSPARLPGPASVFTPTSVCTPSSFFTCNFPVAHDSLFAPRGDAEDDAEDTDTNDPDPGDDPATSGSSGAGGAGGGALDGCPPDRSPTLLARTDTLADEAGRIDGAGCGSAGSPLRRATGTITTPDGDVIATFSGVCVVVPAARLVNGAPQVTPPTVGTDARDQPDGLLPSEDESSGIITLGNPVHPLLAALDATVRSDGDRTWVRFRPAGWLANPTGAVHGAAGCAIADAAATAALERVLPAGSATGVLSADLTFVRSTPMDTDVEAVATVLHVGRRLAVVDVETSSTGCRPSVLARMTVARTTCR
jgi:uncharacterized protein (TIGR00369 family)